MRLAHPNSVSGDLMMMMMGFLDQAGEKKKHREGGLEVRAVVWDPAPGFHTAPVGTEGIQVNWYTNRLHCQPGWQEVCSDLPGKDWKVLWRGKVLHVGNNLVFPVPKINHTDSKTTQAKDKHWYCCLCIHISSAKAQGHLSGHVQCFFYASATNFFSLFH